VNLATIQQQPQQAAVTTTDFRSDDLFEKLRSLRSDLASERNVPAYVIFSDASLKDMVQKLPSNYEEFSQITGVGQVKLENYADAFLKVIEDEKPKEKSSKRKRTSASSKMSLFEKLAGLRTRISEKEQIEEDEIITLSGLRNIADEEPRNLVNLFKNTDTPTDYLNQHAEEFIKIINRHFDQKPAKISSHEYSYQLYAEENFSVTQIAQRR